MAEAPGSKSTLETWSEIAAYLGVTIRTAQTYEKSAGLPVRRLPGQKGRVWALAEEVDAWRLGQPYAVPATQAAASPQPEPSGTASPSSWTPLRVRVVIGAAAFLLAITVGAFWISRRPGTPASFRIDGNVLTILDANSRRVWSHSFPEPIRSHRAAFPSDHWIQFVDLDGDGSISVLFAHILPLNDARGVLYCFRPDGSVRWRWMVTKSARDRMKEIPPTYAILDFRVIPRYGSEGPWIVVSNAHTWTYANLVAVLDRNGKTTGEYWHAGHLNFVTRWPSTGNGPDRVILGGVNNGYASAALVSLRSPPSARRFAATPRGSQALHRDSSGF